MFSKRKQERLLGLRAGWKKKTVLRTVLTIQSRTTLRLGSSGQGSADPGVLQSCFQTVSQCGPRVLWSLCGLCLSLEVRGQCPS